MRTLDMVALRMRLWKDNQEKWGDVHRTPGEHLALIHSEVSEALEELRKDDDPSLVYEGPDGKPEGFGVELADALIRILNVCSEYGIDIEQLLLRKMVYNMERPVAHGGKKL